MNYLDRTISKLKGVESNLQPRSSQTPIVPVLPIGLIEPPSLTKYGKKMGTLKSNCFATKSIGYMSPKTDSTQMADRLVRLEEITPASEYAAYFSVSLAPLVAHLGLPIIDGYDDLDVLKFAFLTLPSLAYYHRTKGERWRNLQESIECFNRSI